MIYRVQLFGLVAKFHLIRTIVRFSLIVCVEKSLLKLIYNTFIISYGLFVRRVEM